MLHACLLLAPGPQATAHGTACAGFGPKSPSTTTHGCLPVLSHSETQAAADVLILLAIDYDATVNAIGKPAHMLKVQCGTADTAVLPHTQVMQTVFQRTNWISQQYD